MQSNKFWKAVEATAHHIVENPRPYLANAALGVGLGGLVGGMIGMDSTVPTLAAWLSGAWKGAAIGGTFTGVGTALVVGIDDYLNGTAHRPHAVPRNPQL